MKILKKANREIDLFSKSHVNANGTRVYGAAHVNHLVHTVAGSKKNYDKLQQDIGETRGAKMVLNEIMPILVDLKRIVLEYKEKEALENRKLLRIIPKKKTS